QAGFLKERSERSPDERSDIRGRPCPVESWSFLHRGFPDIASLIRASVTGFEELIPFRSGHARFRDWHHQFEGRPPRLPSKPRASAPPPSVFQRSPQPFDEDVV